MRKPPARRGRKIPAVIISAAVHVLILAVLAQHAPKLFIRPESRGPPEPIIPVLLTPRLPTPPQARGVRPAPLRLHRRRLRFTAPELPIPPMPAAPRAPAPAPRPGPVTLHPAPMPEGPKGDLRLTLRTGPVGCANPDAAGLSKAERQACAEALGKGAKTEAFRGLAIARDKLEALDRDAAHKEACRSYRNSSAAPFPGLRNGAC